MHLEGLVAEAEVVELPEEEEAFQAVGAPPEEAQEEALGQAQTEGLQEVEDEGSVVAVEATEVILQHCLHVAYAAFREIPRKDLWLAITAGGRSSRLL